MELFKNLSGNEKLKKTLANDIYSSCSSHAYILEGPEGSGKHTASLLAAASFFCTDRNEDTFPCGKCLNCRKTLGGVCTDVITIGRGDNATIGVDVIRDEIKGTLYLAPTEMSKKVYIIEEADKMTPQAQNSLLLSLEEPPEFVVFFLLVTDSRMLLETIRSRAPIIKMQLFSNDYISDYLKKREDLREFENDKTKLAYAVTSSDGALGKAASLLKEEYSDTYNCYITAKRAVSALCQPSVSERLDVVSDFSKDRFQNKQILEYMRKALRDLLALKKSPATEMCFYTDKDEAKKLSGKMTVRKIIDAEQACADAEEDVMSNLNASAVITLLFSKLK